jgi:hypothetical protein
MQSKTHSIIESIFNTISGLILATLVMSFIIAPYYNLQTTVVENFEINLIFTVISIIRGYMWRRYFNKKVVNV